MPHVVIARLRDLMSEFHTTLPAGTVLGEGECPPLSDEVCDILDQIQNSARNVFGRGQPTRSQEQTMEKAGFPILWGLGCIRTPKGLVRYKP